MAIVRKLWGSPQATGFKLRACLPLSLHADLQQGSKTIPTKMLLLMGIIEKEGPRFTSRLLVTIPSASSVCLKESATAGWL